MITKELSKKIGDLLVFRDEEGTYMLFGKFKIVPENDSFLLFDLRNDSLVHNFTNLKNAVTYCVFDNNKKYKELKRIIDLDDQLAGIEVILSQHKKLVEKTENYEDRSIYMAKLVEGRRKKENMLQEIKSYISISKYWQHRKFEENKAK